MVLFPHPRLRGLHDRGRLRMLYPLLRRGTLAIRGGIAQNMRLSAAHFDAWGAQALGVITGEHEPMVQEALRRTLPPGGTFIDVGANVGFTSLVAAALVGPEGRVAAIDPQAECVAAVLANANANGLANVSVLHAAATASSGGTDVIVVEDSLWTRLADVGDHPLAVRRDRVRAVTLDELVASGAVPTPDVVKIDVEGGELHVLAGMRELLSAGRVSVILEMHGKNAEVCDLLESHGYAVTNLDGTEPPREAGDNIHVLATRPRT